MTERCKCATKENIKLIYSLDDRGYKYCVLNEYLHLQISHLGFGVCIFLFFLEGEFKGSELPSGVMFNLS